MSFEKVNNFNCMRWMFYGCSSLVNLDVSNFIVNEGNDIKSMFLKCSDEFRNKIRIQNKNISLEAFIN